MNQLFVVVFDVLYREHFRKNKRFCATTWKRRAARSREIAMGSWLPMLRVRVAEIAIVLAAAWLVRTRPYSH
jgi:hypothetical protein